MKAWLWVLPLCAQQSAFAMWRTRLECVSGIAQLEEHLTERPGTMLMHVWVPDAARDFSAGVNFQCSPSVQSRASTSVHALKIPNTGSHTIVWTQENIAQTGIGSTAFAAAVPYWGKATCVFCKRQRNTKTTTTKKHKKEEESIKYVMNQPFSVLDG